MTENLTPMPVTTEQPSTEQCNCWRNTACSVFRLSPRLLPSSACFASHRPGNPAAKRSTASPLPTDSSTDCPRLRAARWPRHPRAGVSPLPHGRSPSRSRRWRRPIRKRRHRRSEPTAPTEPGSPAPEPPRPPAAIGCSVSPRAADLLLGLSVKQRAARPGTAAVRGALPARRPDVPELFLRRRAGRWPAHCGPCGRRSGQLRRDPTGGTVPAGQGGCEDSACGGSVRAELRWEARGWARRTRGVAQGWARQQRRSVGTWGGMERAGCGGRELLQGPGRLAEPIQAPPAARQAGQSLCLRPRAHAGPAYENLCLASCTCQSPPFRACRWRSASWCRSCGRAAFQLGPGVRCDWTAWWRPLRRGKGVISRPEGCYRRILTSSERLKHLQSSRVVPLTACYRWQRNLKMRVPPFHFLLIQFCAACK